MIESYRLLTKSMVWGLLMIIRLDLLISCRISFNPDDESYTLWLFNILGPWYRWHIELDGLPNLNMGGSFYGYVSHNQMVKSSWVWRQASLHYPIMFHLTGRRRRFIYWHAMPHLICTASHPSRTQMSLSCTDKVRTIVGFQMVGSLKTIAVVRMIPMMAKNTSRKWMAMDGHGATTCNQVRIAWLYLLFIAGSQIFVILAITVPRIGIKKIERLKF